MNKNYYYNINTYHPDNLEIDETSSIVQSDNSANINLKIFAKYNTKTIFYKITTSSGREQSGSFRVGYKPTVGGCPGTLGSCSININSCSHMIYYESKVVNYSQLDISIENLTNSDISDSIKIEICDDENSCDSTEFHLNLDGIDGDCNIKIPPIDVGSPEL